MALLPPRECMVAERLDLTSIEAKFGPRVDGVEPTHVFVMEHGGRPVGWLQWYLWSDYPQHAVQVRAELASAGIDLAIGELAMTGLGLGPVAICEFLAQIVFADPCVTAVVTDPEESNVRSLRAFTKAGFTLRTRFNSLARTSNGEWCAWIVHRVKSLA